MRRIVRFAVAAILAVSIFCALTFSFAYTVPRETVVYVTDTGTKYHRAGCTYLRSSKPMPIYQAEAAGYSPCSRCNPDVEIGVYVSDWERNRNGADSPKREEKESDDGEWLAAIAALVLLGFPMAVSLSSPTKKKPGPGKKLR